MDGSYPYRPGDHVLLLEDIFGGQRPQHRIIATVSGRPGGGGEHFLIHPNTIGTVASWVDRDDIIPYTEHAELALFELADTLHLRSDDLPEAELVNQRLNDIIAYLFDE